jgi:hypothetical protein
MKSPLHPGGSASHLLSSGQDTRDLPSFGLKKADLLPIRQQTGSSHGLVVITGRFACDGLLD